MDFINQKYIPASILSHNPGFHRSTYLYQVGYLGSPINRGLRQGSLPEFLYKIYEELNNLLDKQLPINDENIVVFRGIPRENIGNPRVGDIVYDPAFNSVSLKPKKALYFGNVLLMIKLNRTDKLLYLAGDKYYNDVHECILSPGMNYIVTDHQEIKIGQQDITLVSVDSLGCRARKVSISRFDDDYYHITSPILNILEENQYKLRSERQAIVYYKKGKEGDKYVMGYATTFDDLQIPTISVQQELDDPILKLGYLYIDMFDNEIIAIFITTFQQLHNLNVEVDQLPSCLGCPIFSSV